MEILKCILVGVGVGLVWLPICIGGGFLFFVLRDMGILFLFFLIPVLGILSWFKTRRYLLEETNRYRGACALSERYFFLGAFCGFLLVACAGDVAFSAFFGGFIGAFIGSVGGAFQGWLWPRPRIMEIKDENGENVPAEAMEN
jgi:O-antigen/teichoic acid export membrane protein